MKHSSLQTIREEHASLAAMLQSLRMMQKRGPGNDPQQYFDVLGAMLFYIDEFPEKLHHTKETTLLFPRVLKAAPHVADTVERLDCDHHKSETGVRELQHLLAAWELLGETRRKAFEDYCERYIDAYAFELVASSPDEFVAYATRDRVRQEQRIKISGAKLD